MISKDNFNTFCTFILTQFDYLKNILNVNGMNKIDTIWTILLFIVALIILGALTTLCFVIPFKIGKIIYRLGYLIILFLDKISNIFPKPKKKVFFQKSFYNYKKPLLNKSISNSKSNWIPKDEYYKRKYLEQLKKNKGKR
jgi:magnesium-transporting ATPase (P-type)